MISITKSETKKLLKNIWPFEENHNRHLFETYMNQIGMHRILSDLQLGHQQIHDHLLGQNTSWTANECAIILKSKINEKDNHEKWPLIKGPVNLFVDDKKIKKITPTAEITNKKFGYLSRKENRDDKLRKLELEIEEIVTGEVSNVSSLSEYVSSTNLQFKSVEKILSECKPSRDFPKQSILIFIDILNKKIKDSLDINKINPVYLVKEESSPFNKGWLEKYTLGRKSRNDFLSYLKSRILDNKYPEQELLWAEIVASSVINGGMINVEWTKYLLTCKPSSVEKIKNWIYFVDIWTTPTVEPSNNHSPSWRWQPDSLTRNLVQQLLKNKTDSPLATFSTDKALKCFTHVISSLEFKGKTVNSLCERMDKYWMYHYPSYISDIFHSKNKTSILPKNVYVRLSYGTRLPIKILSSVKEDKNKKYLSEIERENKNNITEYIVLMRNLINRADKSNKRMPKVQLENLSLSIIELLEDYSFPPIAYALSQWLLHMTQEGTIRLDVPTISTVKQYFFSIAQPLSILIGSEDIGKLSEENITDVYFNVIEHSGEQKERKARQLFRFNEIINEYGIAEFDDLNWEYIAGKYLSDKEKHVNSNIVTPEEYTQALTIIANSSIDDNKKLWLGLFLIIGYRFGLRVSEIHHLRLQDIQRLKSHIIIQVQTTIEGRKKSHSSVRQVPLLGELSKLEIDFFDKYIGRITKTDNCSAERPLFLDPANQNELISREIIWNEIHGVLRHVIGDPRIRFHHLRHSYLTGQFMGALRMKALKLPIEMNDNLWFSLDNTIKDTLIEDNTHNAYLISALSSSAGHSRVSTSVHSYIHLVDELAIGYADKALLPEISLSDIGIITGHKLETIKNRMRKYKFKHGKYSAQDFLRTIRIGKEIPSYPYKYNKWPKRYNFDTKQREISLKDIYKVVNNAGINNHSIESIAYDINIPLTQVKVILDIAKHIANKTNFNYFNITNKESWIKSSQSNYEDSKYRHEYIRLNRLIIKTNKILSSGISHEITSLSKAWMASVRTQNKINVLILEDDGDLINFIEGCKVLGYDAKNFRASHSKRTEETVAKRMASLLTDINIKDVDTEKLRPLDKGDGDQRYNFIKIVISKKSKNKPKQNPLNLLSLSKVLFILSVYLRFSSH